MKTQKNPSNAPHQAPHTAAVTSVEKHSHATIETADEAKARLTIMLKKPVLVVKPVYNDQHVQTDWVAG